MQCAQHRLCWPLTCSKMSTFEQQTNLICTPVLVAQWVNTWLIPLLIGHSACCADGLRDLAGLGSNPAPDGGFSARSD